MTQLFVKRIYAPAQAGHSRRILVDRPWPRGLSRQAARIDNWSRDTAPSTGCRRWYAYAAERWLEFRRRFFAGLDAKPEAVAALRAAAIGAQCATLLFASRELRLNSAAALREYLQDRA